MPRRAATWSVVLALGLAVGVGRAQGPLPKDPDELDSLARQYPDQLGLARLAMRAWLTEASRALQDERWEDARAGADRAMSLYHGAPQYDAEEGGSLAQEASMSRMVQGRVAAAEGDDARAAELYREGAEFHPEPRAWMSAGDLSARTEDWYQAQEDYERALELEGVDPDVHLRLAEVLYKLGRTSEALERVEQGAEAGAVEAKVEAMRQRFQREEAVEGGYTSGGNHHFAMSFEAQIDGYVRDRILESLERAYDRVGGLLQTYPKSLVPVVVYPSGEVYRAASGAPNWTVAAYNGKIRIPSGGAADVDDEQLDRVLAHEFTHYLTERLAGQACPAWVQEGLAQHAEAGGDAPTWLSGFLRPILKRQREGQPFPLSVKQIEGRFHGLTGPSVHLAYAVSYYAVQYLVDYGAMFRIHNFLAAIKGGLSPEEALQQELFHDYAKLDAEWLAYARRDLGLD